MAVPGRTSADRIFDAANFLILTLFMLCVVYPIYFVAIASCSDPIAVSNGTVWLWPVRPDAEGYRRVLGESQVWIGYRNTLFYTACGTAINVAVTLPFAYALSRGDLPGRGLFTGVLVLTMLFSGGLIPRYLIVRGLGLLNTPWAMILPVAANAWFCIIAKTFFETSIPKELLHSAQLDGCSNPRFLLTIVLPMSPALIAVIVLFYAVFHWNAFFDAMMFLESRKLFPLQLVLRDILIQAEMLAAPTMIGDAETLEAMYRIAELVKYALIVVAMLPMLVLYPFLQRYFVKGVMVGALKG